MDGLPKSSATNAPEVDFQKLLWLPGRLDNREIVLVTSQSMVLNQVRLLI